MSTPHPTRTPLFPRGSWAETSRIAQILRKETVGGALLLAATVVAMVWANSPWSGGYDALRDVTIGPAAWHLDLPLGTWAADGLLAIFFFVVGLELKREFVAGDLRDPRRAALPIVAAIGGMAVPAVLFALVNLRTGGDALQGWAIPTATDIAFALAVLAVISTHLPSTLRTFLLTLAVVDDLLAITIIAVFYSDTVPHPAPGRLDSVRRLHLRGAAPDPVLVAADSPRRAHLGAGARLRGARHRRRRSPRLRGSRDPQPGGRRPGRRTRAGRALRAPDPADLRRVRGAGVRVLRRRGHRRRPGWAD
ncbi:Na+/H+ antiporter NhaA [Rhodococcus opacus RKJ300 = JCM 13270]|uniref:Na+/H+ antiporter NhaA n=1 Tax=Rhodococcus opacus RKJ300 = JCM 13270 TaxID=1165867 RepID=I0WMX1_RHOOP|nr:Na+/H+ antiporter NhaA [Rhodococcus opacus RKJ300 = JCM 13270]